MELTYEWTSTVAKSFGLIYLMVLSVGITVYAFWPSLGKRFDKAANSLFEDEEGPCQ